MKMTNRDNLKEMPSKQSFYFYDVETSGRSPRSGRIMQFAGQRTNLDLKPIGKAHNIILKLTPDVLPEPDAILTHGITPQKTLQEGISEAEFLQIFDKEIAAPGTIFTGFNSIRFDDEFVRFTLWRNFYDAYEWQWQDGSSRWDLLDVVRMARALRPEGINWPKDDANNRLEVLAQLNGLSHLDAHDALSDVGAVIELAILIKQKQPKLFDFLLKGRDKNRILPMVKSAQPFIYTSGKYPKEVLHTSIVVAIAEHPTMQSLFVYDLRIDPHELTKLDVKDLAELMRYKPWLKADERPPYFPVKELAPNRCPAIAPLEVLRKDKTVLERLQINMADIEKNLAKLKKAKNFGVRLTEASQLINAQPKQSKPLKLEQVDSALYEGFINGPDKLTARAVRAAKPEELMSFANKFSDERLKLLLPLYKARNYPSSLDESEAQDWEEFCIRSLTKGGQESQAAKFFRRLGQLQEKKQDKNQSYLLEELSLYAKSVLPAND